MNKILQLWKNCFSPKLIHILYQSWYFSFTWAFPYLVQKIWHCIHLQNYVKLWFKCIISAKMIFIECAISCKKSFCAKKKSWKNLLFRGNPSSFHDTLILELSVYKLSRGRAVVGILGSWGGRCQFKLYKYNTRVVCVCMRGGWEGKWWGRQIDQK